MSQVIKPPHAERESFGRRLQIALGTSARSRSDLAEILGVHYNTVGNWLRAEADCPVGWVPLIAEALSVPAQDLVRDDPRSPDAARRASDVELARKVITTLEGPLSAPDLMELLAEARRRI